MSRRWPCPFARNDRTKNLAITPAHAEALTCFHLGTSIDPHTDAPIQFSVSAALRRADLHEERTHVMYVMNSGTKGAPERGLAGRVSGWRFGKHLEELVSVGLSIKPFKTAARQVADNILMPLVHGASFRNPAKDRPATWSSVIASYSVCFSSPTVRQRSGEIAPERARELPRCSSSKVASMPAVVYSRSLAGEGAKAQRKRPLVNALLSASVLPLASSIRGCAKSIIRRRRGPMTRKSPPCYLVTIRTNSSGRDATFRRQKEMFDEDSGCCFGGCVRSWNCCRGMQVGIEHVAGRWRNLRHGNDRYRGNDRRWRNLWGSGNVYRHHCLWG